MTKLLKNLYKLTFVLRWRFVHHPLQLLQDPGHPPGRDQSVGLAVGAEEGDLPRAPKATLVKTWSPSAPSTVKISFMFKLNTL